MKKLFYVTLVSLLLIGFRSEGQTTQLTGAQILRSARTIYDQGRLHELPTLLEEALNKERFQSVNERVEAYRILILTYIYLEEPAKADENMLQLLGTDNFFKPIESDQVEFKNLYNKFRTRPVFSVGLRAGLNQTFINTRKNYFNAAEAQGNGTYTPNLGVNLTLVFETEYKKKFVINPELMFNTQAFTYNNDRVFTNDFQGDDPSTTTVETDNEVATATHKITQTRIQLNLLMQYKLGTGKLNPYVFLGPTAGYLLKSSFDGLLQLENNEEIAGKIDNTANYEPFNYSVMAGGGFKYKMGSVYLTGDLRIQYGLLNAVSTRNRNKQTPENIQLTNQFLYTDNDFSIQQAMFHVGIIYPYFKPKKLIK